MIFEFIFFSILMRYYIVLFFTLFNYAAFAQCTISTTKTNVLCNGGNNGSATVNITGGSGGTSNCGVAEASPEACPSTSCTASVTTNTSVTVTSGKTCLNVTNFTSPISVSGGTLVICGSAAPSSFSLTGGTVIINGTLAVSSGLTIYTGATLKNYGTLTVGSGLNIIGSVQNHGTVNINSGELHVYGTGTLQNNSTLTTASAIDVNVEGTGINNKTFTVGGNFAGYNGSTFTNNCALNIAGSFANSTTNFNNKGAVTVNGTATLYNGNSVVMAGGSQFTAGSLSFQGGALSTSGTGCSLFKVNGAATIYAGSTVASNISLCVSGTLNNYAGLSASVFNCNCNLSAPVCTYTWKNASNTTIGTTQTVANLVAGTYNVTANCTNCSNSPLSTSVTITQPAALTATAQASAVSCSNGNVNLTVTGGTSPYTYTWSNGATTQNLTNVAAGTYSVTVKDANNCTQTASATITVTSTLNLTATPTNILCYGASTGGVNLTVTGGATPYTYTWSNGATTQNLTNVAAGSYTVIVKDAANCTKTSPSVSISQPATDFVLSTTLVNVSCSGGNNGAVNLTVSGGTAPYTYTWSNGATTQNLANLVAGTYSVTVKDANNCIRTASAVLPQSTNQVVTPVLTVVKSPDVSTYCPGQIITFTASSTSLGTTTTFKWFVNSVQQSETSSSFVTGSLQNGSQVYAQVTSDAVCLTTNTFSSAVQTIAVTNQVIDPVLTLTANKTFPVADGTSVTFTAASTYSNNANVIKWYKNGVSQSSVAAVFTTTINSFDVVYFTLTPPASESCVVQGTKASVAITNNNSINYAGLHYNVDGNIYQVNTGKIYFVYHEKYQSGALNYKLFDANKNIITNGSLSPKSKAPGDNYYAIDLGTQNNLVSLSFYTLEVVNDKNESKYLKVQFIK